MSDDTNWISYLAAGIVILGLLTNTLSLSYFLQKKSPSPGTVLLISLNLVDLFVCVSSLATWVHSFWFLDNVDQIPPVSFQVRFYFHHYHFHHVHCSYCSVIQPET